MQEHKKHYTITITGKVQEVGFRGYIEDLCKALRVPSITYNTATDELKLICEAEKAMLGKISSGIKEYRLAEIRNVRIEEHTQLPFPPMRAVVEIEHEIYSRLDEGVKILHSIKEDTKMLSSIKANTQLLHSIKEDTKLLYSIKEDTQRIGKKLDKLDEINDTLKKISQKL